MKSMAKFLAVVLAIVMCMGCMTLGAAAVGGDDGSARPGFSWWRSDTAEEDAEETVADVEDAGEAETAMDEDETEDADGETTLLETLFSSRDFEVGYSDYVTITLKDGKSKADGEGVSIDGDVITITEAGTYLLTGTLSDGQIVVELPEDDEEAKAQLVLDDASVTCEGGAALYIKSGDKVFLTTAAKSENLLRSVGEFAGDEENTVDGAIFSKIDLTLNGRGALTVESEEGHGIVCKDDLKLTSGTYEITAGRNGLSAKDSVRISGGTVSIESGNDGIQADSAREEKGYIYIGGGEITIVSGHDGVQASSYVIVEDGELDITAGGGKVNAAEKTTYWNAPGFGRFASENAWEESESQDGAESDSYKGVKAETEITVSGGSITADTADDGIHSNGDVTVSGGEINLKSGDDGIHADASLTVSGGTLTIEAHEGLEGLDIEISGGDIDIDASDDGLNASGGGSPTLLISGGTLHIKSMGDSLDSNGTLEITGGEIAITGLQSNYDGMIDYERSGSISGGVVTGTGMTGMEENFGSASTQGSILYTLSSAEKAGTEISLKDAGGETIVEFTAEESFQVVLISAPEIVSGETYTLTVGDTDYEIEMSSLLYGSGDGMGFGGGFGGMGGHGMNGGQRPGMNSAPDAQSGEEDTDASGSYGPAYGGPGSGKKSGGAAEEAPDFDAEDAPEFDFGDADFDFDFDEDFEDFEDGGFGGFFGSFFGGGHGGRR